MYFHDYINILSLEISFRELLNVHWCKIQFDAKDTYPDNGRQKLDVRFIVKLIQPSYLSLTYMYVVYIGGALYILNYRVYSIAYFLNSKVISHILASVLKTYFVDF